MKNSPLSGFSEKTSQRFWGYLFLAPAFVLLTIFIFVPILQIFYYSITDWNGANQATFVGFQNFIEIFRNPDFYTVLGNNLIIFLLGVPLWTVFPLVIAVLLYDLVKGATFFKNAYFFPSVLSVMIVGTLFKVFFGYMGPINTALRDLGLENLAIEWLAKGITSLPVIVVAVNWAGFGSAVLIYLAAMSSIDPSIYEAASLDGVRWFDKLVHITLPSIKGVVEFTIVLNIIHAFSTMFSYVLAITGGGPGYESTVLEYFIYLKGIRAGQMGYASALSVILFLLVLLASSFQFKFRKSED